jgi:hypothetical protein
MNAKRTAICGLVIAACLACSLVLPATRPIDWESVLAAKPLLPTLGADEYHAQVRQTCETQDKADANAADIQRQEQERLAAKQAAELAAQQAAETAQQSQQQSTTYSTRSVGSLSDIIAGESGGNPNAVNGQYKGIGQLSESYYERYLGKSWSEVAGDASAQEQAMSDYVQDRYGSDEAAIEHWNEYHWY